jgi:hypothetical protein
VVPNIKIDSALGRVAVWIPLEICKSRNKTRWSKIRFLTNRNVYLEQEQAKITYFMAYLITF